MIKDNINNISFPKSFQFFPLLFNMQGSSCGKILACFVFVAVPIFTSASIVAAAGSSSTTDHHLDQNEHFSNEMSSSGVSAIFVFGDSTVDPGNNNYIKTTARSNFLPYGRDLVPDHMPTGRFSNGKLVTDFIGSYLGIKELVPPYLDTTLSFQELMTGVSFASASTGFDPVTAQTLGVISIQKQLDYFREYKAKLQTIIGEEKTEDHIKKSFFAISAGSNDFLISYIGLQIRSKTFTISDYQTFLIQKTQEFLQGLWELGGRRIMIIGLPPIGCLPIVITLKSDDSNNILKRECLDKYSAITNDYNTKLQEELVSIQQSFANHGGIIAYADVYKPLQDIISNYDKFGFEEQNGGCCGTGLVEFSTSCNPTSFICPDASKYIFWDSVHPTEKTYHIVFTNVLRAIVDLILAPQ